MTFAERVVEAGKTSGGFTVVSASGDSAAMALLHQSGLAARAAGEHVGIFLVGQVLTVHLPKSQ